MAESEAGYSPPELEVIQTLQEKVDSPEKNNSNESFCPAVLLAKYEGLLKGEVVELPSHAVIALDIESFSTLQNSGPEFVTQISELTMAYRSKMVEMSQNEKYGDMLFLKSAGDELLFAQDYRDIGDFLRVSLFVIDSQIAFNELLEQDEFAKIKQFYKNKNLKETHFVQPGICIPTAHQKHNLALKLADIDGQLELVTVGSSLVAKKWAREFYTGAQFGVVEDNGFSRHATLKNVLQDVSKTFFSRSSKDKLPSLDLSVLSAGEPTLEDLRVLGTQIEARLSTMSKPPRVTNQLAPDVLAEVSRKMFPNIEIPPSKEVITNEGEFAFVQAKGIDLTRYLIERELLTSNISGRVKSKIVSDFVAEAAALTAADLTHLLKEDGWALNETEWLASVPAQIADKQDDQNREGTFMANGSLVLVMSRSVLDTPPAGTENSIDGLLTACRYIESPEYIEKITKLIEQVASNNGAENVIDVSRVMSNLQAYNGIGINIGVASLEEEDVNAYYNDYRNNDAYEGSAFIGGNGPSLAARRAYANNLARPSITMAPQVAQKWGLSEATATTLVEKALKGFPTKKQMLVYEV